ncbi:hypothetical protein l13_06520 [Neisseria weaveri ATCC 51223]|nr:hypothetical protein l13_06520 [Neisseria weaveri ATCC 51223]
MLRQFCEKFCKLLNLTLLKYRYLYIMKDGEQSGFTALFARF